MFSHLDSHMHVPDVRVNRFAVKCSAVEISSMLRDFAKILRLTIAESCFQKADLHRWTWYSNTSGARQETDHVHVGGR